MLTTFHSFLPMVGLLTSIDSPQYRQAKGENMRRCVDTYYICTFIYKMVAQHIHVQAGFREKCNDSKGQF